MAAEMPLESHLARFRLSSFRPGQREVISALLAGQDCLCIMPTGGGKSLCYQLPAVAREGLTLVVSPLIALMKDQVDSLTALGIAATFINSSLSPAEAFDRMNRDGGRASSTWSISRPNGSAARCFSKSCAKRTCSFWRSMKRTASASGGTISGPTMPASAGCGSG